MKLVCERLNLTGEELSRGSKSITAVNGRSLIALFARKYQCLPLQEVASQMNKSSGTISRLAVRGEGNENLVALARFLHIELTQ